MRKYLIAGMLILVCGIAGAASYYFIFMLPQIKENQFLVYNYREIKRNLLNIKQNNNNQYEKLSSLRDKTNLYLEYTKANSFDEEIASLYSNFLDSIDATDDYIADIELIDRNILARSNEEVVDNLLDFLFSDKSVADNLLDAFFQGKARDEAKVQALKRATRDYERKMSSIRARESNAVTKLAERYKWGMTNEGFLLEPFTAKKIELYNEFNKASMPADWNSLSLKYAACVPTIPERSIYDEHRANYYYWAGMTAARGEAQQLTGGEWGTLQSPFKNRSSDYIRNALKFNQTDEDGILRFHLAYSLALQGDFQEAYSIAQQINNLYYYDPSFNYLFSCVSTKLNNNKAAIKYLERMLAKGQFPFCFDQSKSIDVKYIRNDINMKNLHKSASNEFRKICSVDYEWKIIMGILLDDIIIYNKSAFPITNVRLKVRIEAKDKVFTPYLKTDFIAPGESHTWGNVVSIPDSKFNKAEGELACDQY